MALTDAMAELRANAVLLVATTLGVATGLGVGIATGSPKWPHYLIVIVLGAAVVVTLHLRHGFSLATRVGLAVFAVAHVAGGMIPVGEGVLYGYWLVEPIIRYDNVQHAWGFGFAGRATWEILRPRLGSGRDDGRVTWWLIVLAAAATGSINEIIEWILTLTVPGTDVGGYDNTARDLVANLVGGILVATWTVRMEQRHDRATPDLGTSVLRQSRDRVTRVD